MESSRRFAGPVSLVGRGLPDAPSSGALIEQNGTHFCVPHVDYGMIEIFQPLGVGQK
jgi:hypothetical protein